MTAAQERRLLLAALDYAHAEIRYRAAKQTHILAKRHEWVDIEGHAVDRDQAARERRLLRDRLFRAAGIFRKQPLLPIEKARIRSER